MNDNLFVHFIFELIRALLIDELSERVRGGIARRLRERRRLRTGRGALLDIQRRNRDRLLNRLLTGADPDL